MPVVNAGPVVQHATQPESMPVVNAGPVVQHATQLQSMPYPQLNPASAGLYQCGQKRSYSLVEAVSQMPRKKQLVPPEAQDEEMQAINRKSSELEERDTCTNPRESMEKELGSHVGVVSQGIEVDEAVGSDADISGLVDDIVKLGLKEKGEQPTTTQSMWGDKHIRQRLRSKPQE
ncbi:MAG: hypothetical protein Q9178_006475 [Gyalolechia marmorata]